MKETKRTNGKVAAGKAAGSIELLELDVLTWGGTCQLRAEIDEKHVQRLADALDRDQASVPAIGVLYDSRHYWVWDGNHRILAAQRIGAEKILCRVEPGTERDARLRAAGANASHGLPRTAADKKCAVTTLLADKVWGKRSDRWIADACQVSHTFVSKVRTAWDWDIEQARLADDQLATLPVDEPREGRDGKVRRQPEPDPKPTPDRAPLLDGPGELLPDDLARKIRNTPASADPKQVARLARLSRQDPELAQTVASMLRDCEVSSVEEALVESDTVPEEPEEEASAVLKDMLRKAQSEWRIACPKKACPTLGAAVLEQVADEWLNGGWFR